MAGIILSNTKKKDVTKANPRLLETYSVNFPDEYKQFKDSVTVKFKHIDAVTISRCFVDDGDGNRYLDDFRIFEKCVKEIHGLSQYRINEDGQEEAVPMTVEEVIHFQDLRAEAEDKTNAMSLVFLIVHDVAQAIIAKATLTEEEEKNLYADVRHS